MFGKKKNFINTLDKRRYLVELKLFQDLPPRDIDELLQKSTLIWAKKGHTFYRPGQASETVYILIRGRVHLYRINPDGKKLVMTIVGPQTVFDDMTLLDNQSHQNFAESADACLVLAIARSELTRMMERNPQLVLQILNNAWSRLQNLESKLESIVFKDVAARLSELLLTLAQEHDGSAVIGFTHQDLAESLGAYRETTTNILNALQSRGGIEIQRKRINILNTAVLESVMMGA